MWPDTLSFVRLIWLLPILCSLVACGEQAPAAKPLDPKIVALVHDLLEGTDSDVRMAAHRELMEHGLAVVLPLADALDRPDVDALGGAWIAEVLGGLGPIAAPAAPALFRRLMQGGECSATTSWALGQIGDAGVPHLAAALLSPHAATRIWAADALENLGERAAPAADQLLVALNDPEADVRASVMFSISQLPELKALDLPQLMSLSYDEHENVRLGAASALAGQRGSDPAVQQRLREMVVKDEEDYVRSRVLEALDPHLGRGESDIAFLRLLTELPDEEHGLEPKARSMLLERGVDDPELVAAAATIDERDTFETTLRCAESLGRSGPNGRTASLPLLHRILRWSPDAALRAKAATLLGGLGVIASSDEATMELLARHAEPGAEEADVTSACEAALAALARTR